MYAKAEGVTADYKSAHMWFNIAAAGNSVAIKNRDAMTRHMSVQQSSDAQKMARDWQAGRLLAA
jgi:TPR repeat protein